MKVDTTLNSDNFDITEIKDFGSDIIYHNERVTKTQDKLFIGSVDYKVENDVEVLFSPLKNQPILCKIENNNIVLKSLSTIPVQQIILACTDKMIINDILYVKNEGQLTEIHFSDSEEIIPHISQVWNIEVKTSKMLSNIIVQNVLDRASVCIPISTYKESSFIIQDIPELNKLQIIDAKHDNHVAMFITYESGIYNRYIIVFNEAYNKYQIRIINDIEYIPLNFITLQSGVCISIKEDDTLEIFKYQRPNAINEIKDPKVNSSIKLCKKGMEVRFFKGGKLYSIKLK